MRKQIYSTIAGLGLLGGTAFSHLESNTEALEEQLIRHEGYKTNRYYDTKGIPTIGVGFNLTRPDASNLVQKVGADYTKVLDGKQALNDVQIKYILSQDIANAVKDAKKIVKSYDNQPTQVQEIIVNMTFNLGSAGFRKFKKTISAIEARDYETASKEMENSNWYNQVGNRSKELVNKMRTVQKNQN